MLIRHLALNVRDPARSREFYLGTIGLSAEPVEEPWGIRMKFPDGFMLALIAGEPVVSGIDAVHFGCALPTPGDVRAIRRRLRAAGVREVAWDEEPRYVGLKVEDPDGYVVELAYDLD